ncbi:MAG: hypothetical protein L0154_00245, partial [Chloroflexi bacterium]|nr:hypothetical protein [Chloroflexota bacterium]
MKRLLLLLLAGILFATPTITIAQSDEAQARIDQAMADLSERLGITITRETHFWQWSERVFDDGSLGCPVPGQTYTQGQVVGYSVQITVGTTVYDYRLSPDGSLMVLCGEDGSPIDRTDQEVPPSPTPIATATPQIQPVPEAMWYAWVYLDGTDLLYLLTPEGPIASILRPAHPNEATPREVRMVISPDGRYLVQTHALASGNDVLSIYDFATGDFQIVNVAVGETAHLGYSVNDLAGPAGYTHIFNYPSDRVVVGLSNVEAGTWRLVVIDLDTGTFLNQLSNTDLAAKLPDGADELLVDAVTGPGNFFVRPLYFDGEGRFHAQLILANAGGGEIVPAFQWNIAANTVSDSFYNKSSLDILPDDGTALFTYLDEDLGFLEPVGPFSPRNTIGIQRPEQQESTPVYVNTDFFIFSQQWADDGSYIAFETNNIEFSESRFLLFELGTEPNSALLLPETYEQITGVPGGIIAYDQMRIVYHNTDSESSVVWDVPPRNGEAHIIWAQPPNREPQLAQLDLSELGNQVPADEGAPPPAVPT